MSPARIVAVTRLVIAVMEDLSDQDMDLLSAAEADFAALLIPHVADLRMIHSLALREMNTLAPALLATDTNLTLGRR